MALPRRRHEPRVSEQGQHPPRPPPSPPCAQRLCGPNPLVIGGSFILSQEGNPNSHSLPFTHTNSVVALFYESLIPNKKKTA